MTRQLTGLSLSDISAMASIAQQLDYPLSETSLQGCFGALYRVSGIRVVDELVGFCICQQIIDEVTLLDICVAPAYQGQGIGCQLLQDSQQAAKQANAVVIMLEVKASNLGAQRLYQKFGFEQTGKRPNYYQTPQGREDAILMDWRID
ncbi:ribosomal protein S18-alanine N-acetyltransferase [Shewanella sp. NIFS-20-20]|uniref:ribosomal protein S18-alanine N-acetyltransferase n=1 Tax=Shewanella sp. NIFS-20-20 TaxID=2853806 RepID=UPI001C4549E7|nr:ribosomal protein S18-alanine N-acetyltransferase [Shewanella sp. NIFS-20-20]MBV7315867.1 ribosomal protein S18-alanine N-acetyltransferase [Shewanella sp. NIFS-20-20]